MGWQKRRDCYGKKIKDFFEEENIYISEDVYDGKHHADLEFYSELGEDFVFSICSDGTKKNFVEKFCEYASDFDPDEHAEEWVKNRDSVSGVPHSIRELINDADDIKERLEDLAKKLAHLR